MDEAMFAKTYPHADDFREAIAFLNGGSTRFSSLLSNRLGIIMERILIIGATSNGSSICMRVLYRVHRLCWQHVTKLH